MSPPNTGCGASGLLVSMSWASWKISWKKYGISLAAFASLKAIASASVLFAIGTPIRVAKYFCRSTLKSNSSTKNSPSAGAKVKPDPSRSTTVAPAAAIAARALSNTATTCGGALSMPCRVAPMRAPCSPFASTNAV